LAARENAVLGNHKQKIYMLVSLLETGSTPNVDHKVDLFPCSQKGQKHNHYHVIHLNFMTKQE
jgi:hypothetical protein